MHVASSRGLLGLVVAHGDDHLRQEKSPTRSELPSTPADGSLLELRIGCRAFRRKCNLHQDAQRCQKDHHTRQLHNMLGLGCVRNLQFTIQGRRKQDMG